MSLIVTSGKSFLDIDAYASIVAYAELLNLQGIPAVPASTAQMNESITPTARQMKTDLQTSYKPDSSDNFVIVDVSEPEFLDAMVATDQVVEVIDHHVGYEQYWQERGAKTEIDLIGAACTLIYERWEDAGLVEKISETSAKLLSLGILDNTLNFNAEITSQRDRATYQNLKKIAHLSEDWEMKYFMECQECIVSDVNLALANDTKIMEFPGLVPKLKIGQLVVWEGLSFLEKIRGEVESSPHLVNLVSIRDGHSYFLTKDSEVQVFLSQLLGARFTKDTAIADRLWLRKEIMIEAVKHSV